MTRIIKQNKFIYYIKSYLRYIIPAKNHEKKITLLEAKLSSTQLLEAENRIKYYNKLTENDFPFPTTKKVRDLRLPKSPKTYYHDTFKYARRFDQERGINFVFGDVIHVPKIASIVKSRPIGDNNKNSILLKLNEVRHFVWVKDTMPFLEKRDMLIGRAVVQQPHRIDFYEKYFHHPLCNLGQINLVGGKKEWVKPKISIAEHLQYKFILSLRGNDVATNLKWIMSSNSIAVMPKATIESWFMEGNLVGGTHFIELKEDYSDIEEQLEYYIAHPEECQKIIINANRFCEQFYHKDVEEYINLKVLDRYLNHD